MKYRNAIIAIGILIAITLSPFIGIPRTWKEGIAGILALGVSTLAYLGSRPKGKSVSPTSDVHPETVSVPSDITPSNPQ